jgi:uncharacterized protein YndB with AHSA1/START domain
LHIAPERATIWLHMKGVLLMVQDQISREITINASIDRVWTLLTEGIGKWFPDNGAEVDLKTGGNLNLRWREYGTFHGVIERLDPQHTFAVRWSMNADEPPAPGNSTHVEFTLTPESEGVRLRVVESGFSQLAISPAAQAERAEGNTEGWASELDELRVLAEQPAA